MRQKTKTEKLNELNMRQFKSSRLFLIGTFSTLGYHRYGLVSFSIFQMGLMEKSTYSAHAETTHTCKKKKSN